MNKQEKEIRTLDKTDIKDYIYLTRYAFMEWNEKEPDEDALQMWDPNDVIGVFDNDSLVSGMAVLHFEQNIRGVLKKMGGISSVVTKPEYRKKGCISGLFKYAFPHMREKGMSTSMLLPFRQRFYQKYGYVIANSTYYYAFETQGLSPWIDTELPEGWSVTSGRATDTSPEFLDFLRECSRDFHGFVVYDQVPEKFVERRFKDTLTVLVKDGNNVLGALRYLRKGGFDQYGKAFVTECLWRNRTARDILFRYLALHADQLRITTMTLPSDWNPQSWLLDSKTYAIRPRFAPWMVRIVDVIPAMEGIPVSTAGEITLKVIDRHCEWNCRTVRLTVEDGVLVASGVREDVSVPVISVEGLTALLYGTIDAQELLHRGELGNIDQTKLNTLTAWFPTKMIFNTFGF